jgi:hypothetical protein
MYARLFKAYSVDWLYSASRVLNHLIGQCAKGKGGRRGAKENNDRGREQVGTFGMKGAMLTEFYDSVPPPHTVDSTQHRN